MGVLNSVGRFIGSGSGSGSASTDDATVCESVGAQLTKKGFDVDSRCEPEECAACPKYPASVKVADDPLWGSTDSWEAHIIVATGADDWIRDVNEIEGSITQAIGNQLDHLLEKTGLQKIKISASNLPVNSDGTADVIVLPKFKIIKSATPENVVALVIKALDTKSLDTGGNTGANAQIINDGSKGYILLCSHKTRDKRCGITAPIMKKQFDACLRHHELYRDPDDDTPGGVKVVFINHVGGHKFVANVFVYTDKQAIWMARCTPVHCKAIVDNTVLENKIVFPQLLRQAVKW